MLSYIIPLGESWTENRESCLLYMRKNRGLGGKSVDWVCHQSLVNNKESHIQLFLLSYGP